MKTYQVELQCISYTRVCVTAENLEDAEVLAYEQIQRGGFICDDGSWDIASVEELT
jgi:hypothetical protein